MEGGGGGGNDSAWRGWGEGMIQLGREGGGGGGGDDPAWRGGGMIQLGGGGGRE